MKPYRTSDLHGASKNFRDLVQVVADVQEPGKYVDPTLRLVVAGSREGIPPELVYRAITVWVSKYGKPELILSGKARGVDRLGELWAKNNKVDVLPFPANWDKFGKVAGHIRNEKMAIACSHGLVIHNNSPGSLNIVMHLRKLNKPIIEVVRHANGSFDIKL